MRIIFKTRDICHRIELSNRRQTCNIPNYYQEDLQALIYIYIYIYKQMYT
jgi:hypothetical protein